MTVSTRSLVSPVAVVAASVAVVMARAVEAAVDVVVVAVEVPVVAAVTVKAVVAEVVAVVLAATATLPPGLRKLAEDAVHAFRDAFNGAPFCACLYYEGISNRKTVLRVLD
jgi:hypothetical protein